MDKSTNVTYTLTDAEQFFYDNAGWSYWSAGGETSEHGRIMNAMGLALAEAKFRRSPAYLVWEVVFAGEADRSEGYTGPVWQAAIYIDDEGPDVAPNVLASLNMIEVDSESSDYARVVNAELAMQAGF